MGRVYLGRSPGGRPVAVKVIHPSVADEPAFRTRFRREVEAARRVGGFHTAQVVDVDAEADPPWIVSAYISGPSLRDAVNEHGPLPPASVLTLGAGIAEGLSAVHACGLVHRDLKPGNVLISADGPRILDFGIAHLVDAPTLTASGALIGTPAYMSPEQASADDDELGPASDVFSLGAVLAFAATGRSPFAATSIAATVYRILNEEPDLTGLPDPLRGLVTGCLARAPADRPDVAELIERLAPDARHEDWLPASVIEMITERSLTAPDAADPARGPGMPPGPETPPPTEVPQWGTGPTNPDKADAAAAMPRRADMDTTGGPVPPSAAPRRPKSGAPARRRWLIAISASAVAVPLVTTGVFAACAPFGSGPEANQAGPEANQAGPVATTASPTKAVTTKAGSSRAVTPTAKPTKPGRTPTTSTSRSVSSSRPGGPVVVLTRGETGDYNENCQAPECAKMHIVMSGFEPNTEYRIEPFSPTDEYSNPGAGVTTDSSGYADTDRFDYNGVGEKVYVVVEKDGTEVARSKTIVWPSG